MHRISLAVKLENKFFISNKTKVKDTNRWNLRSSNAIALSVLFPVTQMWYVS